MAAGAGRGVDDFLRTAFHRAEKLTEGFVLTALAEYREVRWRRLVVYCGHLRNDTDSIGLPVEDDIATLVDAARIHIDGMCPGWHRRYGRQRARQVVLSLPKPRRLLLHRLLTGRAGLR